MEWKQISCHQEFQLSSRKIVLALDYHYIRGVVSRWMRKAHGTLEELAAFIDASENKLRAESGRAHASRRAMLRNLKRDLAAMMAKRTRRATRVSAPRIEVPVSVPRRSTARTHGSRQRRSQQTASAQADGDG